MQSRRDAVQAAAAGMRAQARLWGEVRDNLSEGARFYASLQEAVAALQQHIGDFCLTRGIQRCRRSSGAGPVRAARGPPAPTAAHFPPRGT